MFSTVTLTSKQSLTAVLVLVTLNILTTRSDGTTSSWVMTSISLDHFLRPSSHSIRKKYSSSPYSSQHSAHSSRIVPTVPLGLTRHKFVGQTQEQAVMPGPEGLATLTVLNHSRAFISTAAKAVDTTDNADRQQTIMTTSLVFITHILFSMLLSFRFFRFLETRAIQGRFSVFDITINVLIKTDD